MQKALGVSPSQYWGQLFQMGLSEFNQKHVLVYLHDSEAQQGLTALNFDGRMQEAKDQDYLHINDANLGGAKSNMFVKEYIKVDYQTEGTGAWLKILRLIIKIQIKVRWM